MITTLTDIKAFVAECDTKFAQFCTDVQVMEGAEDFEDTDYDGWANKLKEITQQVVALLILSTRFMTQNNRETIYLAALHCAEYAEDGSASYEGLAKAVSEYIINSLNNEEPYNKTLAKTIKFWLEPVETNNVIDLTTYKRQSVNN